MPISPQACSALDIFLWNVSWLLGTQEVILSNIPTEKHHNFSEWIYVCCFVINSIALGRRQGRDLVQFRVWEIEASQLLIVRLLRNVAHSFVGW